MHSFSLFFSYILFKTNLPSQVTPSAFNSYPGLHVHVNDPAGELVQPPFVSSHPSVLAVHSSISNFLKEIQFLLLLAYSLHSLIKKLMKLNTS